MSNQMFLPNRKCPQTSVLKCDNLRSSVFSHKTGFSRQVTRPNELLTFEIKTIARPQWRTTCAPNPLQGRELSKSKILVWGVLVSHFVWRDANVWKKKKNSDTSERSSAPLGFVQDALIVPLLRGSVRWRLVKEYQLRAVSLPSVQRTPSSRSSDTLSPTRAPRATKRSSFF